MLESTKFSTHHVILKFPIKAFAVIIILIIIFIKIIIVSILGRYPQAPQMQGYDQWGQPIYMPPNQFPGPGQNQPPYMQQQQQNVMNDAAQSNFQAPPQVCFETKSPKWLCH